MFLVIKVFPDMRFLPLLSLIGFVSFIIFSRGSHPYCGKNMLGRQLFFDPLTIDDGETEEEDRSDKWSKYG